MKRAAPCYVHPVLAPDAWRLLLAGGLGLEFAVVNVADGPGDGSDPGYDVLRGQSSGTRLVGYVDANFARRPVDEVLADALGWQRCYGITAVMLDQCPPDEPGWCRDTAASLRGVGCDFLVANPGTMPATPLPGLDVVCTAELDWATYAALPEAHFVADTGAGRRWHLIHSCPAESRAVAEALAEARGADLVWVSTATLPNPWDAPRPAAAVPLG